MAHPRPDEPFRRGCFSSSPFTCPAMPTKTRLLPSRMAGPLRPPRPASCQVSLWLSLVAVLGLIFSGHWIIKIWTKNAVEMNFSLFYIMLFTIIFSSFWYTSFAVLTSTNQHHKIMPKYLLVTLVYLCACTILTPYLGLNSAAICLMMIEVTMLVFVLKESLRLLDDRLQFYFKSLFDMSRLLSLVKR